ncbi:antitoxin [Allopusillimonas soli]|uniref:Antitoxin n=1 Tax=Allopusillimonas soli TaxID=659016 RepID=A0A853FDJ4_9BURK|nr:type II toxin-antitoxin system VapB family antitoxin [Allopusillimonas soli]NYT37798.1 antitoxin [Allopusillimonas soli]TEA73709.1 antitoxin [Allopusillimonas soli]
MSRTTVFMNNRSQAVRLPKALELPENVKQVEVTAIGRARLISPIDATWDSWFDGPGVTEDFMNERSQPESQARETL